MTRNDHGPKRIPVPDWIHRLHPRAAILIIVAILVSLFLYRSAFEWLIGIWSNDKDYSHGFLIIPICVYLVWIMRDRMAYIHPTPGFAAGAIVVLASMALLLAGRAGGVVLAEAVSLLILVPGVVLFVWGWNAVKAFALPLAYLQFMVPWMEEFISRVHGPFQLMSAHIGVWILNVIGIAVYQEGKFIMLPNATLEVAQTCSGVRYLTSVVALGIPLVYLTQRSWSRAFGVIGSGVAITALTNGARVGFVGYMTYHYGLGLSHGPFHVFQGWFAAQIGFVVLFLVNWGIGRIPSGDAVCLSDRWKAGLRTSPDGVLDSRPSLLRIVVVILFLSGAGAYIHWYGAPDPLPTRQPIERFPLQVAEWSGKDIAWIHGGVLLDLPLHLGGSSTSPILKHSGRGNR
jgi:exosortase